MIHANPGGEAPFTYSPFIDAANILANAELHSESLREQARFIMESAIADGSDQLEAVIYLLLRRHECLAQDIPPEELDGVRQ